MANEFKSAFENFEASLEDGKEIKNSNYKGIVTTVSEYFDVDEADCEESWSNFLDCEGLPLVVCIEDILNGKDLQFVLEEEAEKSFINGQFKQMLEQLEKLNDYDSFVDYLEQNSEKEVEILRCLVRRLL
ncbi:hypothetical protein AB9X29_003742 [Vibrio vulnificus]